MFQSCEERAYAENCDGWRACRGRDCWPGAAPKAEASSAKYTIKQYRTVKKYKHGIKATSSYQLPQLKGNSAAIKKINKDIN